MNVMERLRAGEAEWRERQATNEQAWRDRREELDRQWRKEDLRLAKTNMFVAVGIGILSAIATLIAAKAFPW